MSNTEITPSRPVAEVLRKALAAFGPNGEHWTKHFEDDGHGNFCAYGAVRKIIPYGSDDNIIGRDAIDCLRSVVGEKVAAWNDDPRRTFAQVRAAFKKAIAKAEKQP